MAQTEQKKYDQFKLKVSADGKITAEWITHKREEAYEEGTIALDNLYRRLINRLITRLRADELYEGEFEDLGDLLYRAIFPGAISRLFKQASDEVRQNESRRLSLLIDAEAHWEVRDWPLEFLRYNETEGGGSFFLATRHNSHITLSRRVSLPSPKAYEPHGIPLRVLIVVSQPKIEEGYGGVISKPTVEDITRLAYRDENETEQAVDIEIKILGSVEGTRPVDQVTYLDKLPTLENLSDILHAWRPDVLHFIGHGKVAEDGRSYLALVNELENIHWCSANNISEICFTFPPKLVFLQACETAKPETNPGFMSMATHLMKHKISAVVAMQFEISNARAIDFARNFYHALAEGVDIDQAVQEGRTKLLGQEGHFGTPVLYVLDTNSIISPVSKPPLLSQIQQSQMPNIPAQKLYQPKGDSQGTLERAERLAQQGFQALALSLLEQHDKMREGKQSRSATQEMTDVTTFIAASSSDKLGQGGESWQSTSGVPTRIDESEGNHGRVQ